ncbi:hypothetical protein AB4Y42_20760 [Paraburkholderia sp. EG286B]|uniref:hypothetical protein n=1 Tax=Paraburkholderia sp. EG286B TaxID=3237011 RepID=UPI0034D35917
MVRQTARGNTKTPIDAVLARVVVPAGDATKLSHQKGLKLLEQKNAGLAHDTVVS